MGKFAAIWDYDTFDIISYTSSYNIIGFKFDIIDFILVEPVKMGTSTTFIPGHSYTRIGNNRNTSSGWTYYDGEPIQFYGRFQDFILFTKSGELIIEEGYTALFFCFRILNENNLFTVNRAGSGRLIELD